MSADGRNCHIVFLVLIAGRKQKDALLTLLSDIGARVANTVYGKGSVRANSSLLEAFGFVPEEHKVIITCLLPRDKGAATLETLVRKFAFDKPNTGIAFMVPVDGVSF
jgi:hypothetical protein